MCAGIREHTPDGIIRVAGGVRIIPFEAVRLNKGLNVLHTGIGIFTDGGVTEDGELQCADIARVIGSPGLPVAYLKSYISIGYVTDMNCDGFPDVLDLGYLVDYLFNGGPPSPC